MKQLTLTPLMEDNTDDYRMIFRTIQSNAIKTLIEGLKDIIVDVSFHVNSEGIQVTAVDGKLVTMVNLNLIASGFEHFFCVDPITLCINIKSLFIFLKTVSNNDVITMAVLKNNINRLQISIENKDKNMRVISYLKLLDFNEETYIIPDVKFDSVIKMPSNDFQNYCKNLSNISDTVTIENKNNEFSMSVHGDAGSTKIILG